MRSVMIKIVTDEEVHEMDIELIELFAVYLFDKDVEPEAPSTTRFLSISVPCST